MTQVETPLQGTRLEYVEETSFGEFVTDPAWNVLTDYLKDFTFSPSPNKEATSVVGESDFKEMFRGAEEPELSAEYYKQQGFVGSSGDPQYPAGHLVAQGSPCDLPSYNVVYRRESDCDGNFDSGYREYLVAKGVKNTEVTDPGDPSDAEPIIEEATFPAQKVRSYVIHKLDSDTTLDVENTGSNSVDVTIESEGGGVTDTVTVAGGSTQTTVETFPDVDVIYAESEHDGDILVTDGSGTDVLDADTQLAGSDTDGVESDRGIPPLGSGSHGSAIGTDPTDYRFQGVDTLNWQGSAVSDRVHALDLSVSVDVSREPITGIRGTSIDTGIRTVEVSADTAGPYESATRIAQMYHNESGDFVYSYPDNDVTVNNAELSEAPDLTRTAGDTNYIPSTTWQGKIGNDTESISVTYTGA